MIRDQRPVLSTLVADVDQDWNRVVRTVRPVGRPGGPRDLLNLWRLAAGREVLILQGSAPAAHLYRDLVLALLVKLRRKRPRILLTDSTWELGSHALSRRFPWAARLLPAAMRLFLRLLDGPHVTYGVLSTEEARTFPERWGVPTDRVVFLEFTHTLWGDAVNTETSDKGYLFAGGNSLRNYDLLEEAVKDSDFDTVVASSWKPEVSSTRIRADLVPHGVFMNRLAGARAVVVPLRAAERSAGQQTYLNAMALGKPVVVTDSPGVRDYIVDGVNGWIAPGGSTDLNAVLQFVMDADNRGVVERVAQQGRSDVLTRWNEFTYRAQLLRIAGV